MLSFGHKSSFHHNLNQKSSFSKVIKFGSPIKVMTSEIDCRHLVTIVQFITTETMLTIKKLL
jgi:hypothetical protein